MGHSSTTNVSTTANGSFSWGDFSLGHSVDTTIIILKDDGCDSLVHLHVNVVHRDTIFIDTTVCGPTFIMGYHFTYSQTRTFSEVDEQGNTIVTVVHCTVHPEYDYTDNVELTNDSLYWKDGEWYYTSTDTPMVRYSSVWGCDSFWRLHLVVHEDLRLWGPNVFTPDAETNNRFQVFGYGIYKMEVQIFNRWGEMIAEFDGLNGWWDGTHKGKPCPQGAYVCRVGCLPMRRVHNKLYFVKTVTLLR